MVEVPKPNSIQFEKCEGFLTTKVRFDLMWHDMKNWECHLNLQPNVYLIAKQQIFINLNKGDLK